MKRFDEETEFSFCSVIKLPIVVAAVRSFQSKPTTSSILSLMASEERQIVGICKKRKKESRQEQNLSQTNFQIFVLVRVFLLHRDRRKNCKLA